MELYSGNAGFGAQSAHIYCTVNLKKRVE